MRRATLYRGRPSGRWRGQRRSRAAPVFCPTQSPRKPRQRRSRPPRTPAASRRAQFRRTTSSGAEGCRRGCQTRGRRARARSRIRPNAAVPIATARHALIAAVASAIATQSPAAADASARSNPSSCRARRCATSMTRRNAASRSRRASPPVADIAILKHRRSAQVLDCYRLAQKLHPQRRGVAGAEKCNGIISQSVTRIGDCVPQRRGH